MAFKGMNKLLKEFWKDLEEIGVNNDIILLAINVEEELIAIKYQCRTATIPLWFFYQLWEKLMDYNLTADVQVNILKAGEYREIEVLITHRK